MNNIPGLGKSKINLLKNKGIKSKKDLYKKNVFISLPIETQYYLTYNPSPRVPRYIIDVVKSLFIILKINGTITGSYLRGLKSSKDIDFISRNTHKNVESKLKKFNIVLHTYAKGPDKVSSILDFSNIKIPYKILLDNKIDKSSFVRLKKYKIRFDIWFPKKEEFLFYKFYTTGDKIFNLITRKKFKEINPCKLKNHKNCKYLLNRHGLFIIHKINSKEVKKRVNIKSEKELFKLLGMKYKYPKERSYSFK